MFAKAVEQSEQANAINLPAHKGDAVRQIIEDAGAELRYLPPYSAGVLRESGNMICLRLDGGVNCSNRVLFETVNPVPNTAPNYNAAPDDLAPAIGRDRDGDYGGDRDDAAAVADLQVGGVEPQIRPFAVYRPIEEAVDPLVDVFAQLCAASVCAS